MCQDGITTWTDFMPPQFASCRYITCFRHYLRCKIDVYHPCGHDIIMGASCFDHYPSYSMPKLCCAVDCLKSAVATVAVNTSVGIEDSGPPIAPLDSAWKIRSRDYIVALLYDYLLPLLLRKERASSCQSSLFVIGRCECWSLSAHPFRTASPQPA